MTKYVKQSSIISVIDYFKKEIVKVTDMVNKVYGLTSYGKVVSARVVRRATEKESKLYGKGALVLLCPGLDGRKFAARMRRSVQGQVIYPDVGDWVKVQKSFDDKEYEWFGATQLGEDYVYYGLMYNKKSKEKVGYFKLPLSDFSDRYEKALDRDKHYRIINSSDKMVFAEDGDEEEVELRAGDGYKLNITVGDDGKIYIGNASETTDSPLLGADVEIGLGLSGELLISHTLGVVRIESPTTNVVIDPVSGKVDVKAVSLEADITSSAKVKALSVDVEAATEIKLKAISVLVDGNLEVTGSVLAAGVTSTSGISTEGGKMEVDGEMEVSGKVTIDSDLEVGGDGDFGSLKTGNKPVDGHTHIDSVGGTTTPF